ncbi:MAG: hypothetical protein LBL91_02135, partial [Lachnospiraceae bacterium]|nr:hypothetical protein [Lachnospiraceae bacterium]
TVTFKGEIGGDLFVIAEKLNLESGAIYGNLFAMAGEVTINNQMYDAYISADKVVMNYDGYIYRDLRATTSEIELNGVVRRNAFIDANTVTLNADCIIQGNLNYTAKEELKLPEGVDDITTLVYQNVNFEKNNKNVYSKDISKTVTSLINKTKLDKDAEAEDLKNLIVGTVFDGLGINTNIDKYSSKTVTLPKVVFYGLIAAVVLLAVCVLVLVLTKKKSQNTEKPKKVKEEKVKEKVKEESPIKEEPKAKDENNDQEK